MEALAQVLTSSEFLSRIPSVLLLISVLIVLCKIFKIRIKTEHFQIGGEDSKAYYERAIVRNQLTQAKLFCESLENKILALVETPKAEGYFTKYVLECVYDKICEWIMYNHIENTDEYIESKQWEIEALVYSFAVQDVFKTPEFKERMDRWVAEIIGKLVNIRKLYSKQKKENV